MIEGHVTVGASHDELYRESCDRNSRSYDRTREGHVTELAGHVIKLECHMTQLVTGSKIRWETAG